MDADFCIEALEEALAKHGKPEIFNTDRGSQFTSAEFTGMPLKSGIWVFIIAEGHLRASTGGRPARPTSTGHSVPRRRNWRIGIVALGRQRMQCEGRGHDALRATKLGQRQRVAHFPPRGITFRQFGRLPPLSGFCAPPDWRLAPMRVADRIPVRSIAPSRAGRHGLFRSPAWPCCNARLSLFPIACPAFLLAGPIGQAATTR